jgi:predicted nucleic acid-binding protein
MRNQFPGYYNPTEEEFKKLWENCIFSFDTNILLNVYRYSPKSRERLFEVWRNLNERIWIPHQVALEYLQERLNVISHQSKPYRELQDMLDDASKGFTQKIEEFSRRHSFSSLTDTKELLNILENAHNQIKDALTASSAKYPDLLCSDSFWDEITQLFHKKVGEPYSQKNSSENSKKAENRFKHQQPPGYLDAKKPETERYGDVTIWFQLTDYVKSQEKPLIFVTDDEKEDWWLKHKGKTIGPRPELIQEMLCEGDVEFYLYTGDRFLEYAEKFLKLKNEPEVVKEAGKVRRQLGLEKQFPINLYAIHKTVPTPTHLKIFSPPKENEDKLGAITLDSTTPSVVKPIANQTQFEKSFERDLFDKFEQEEMINKLAHNAAIYIRERMGALTSDNWRDSVNVLAADIAALSLSTSELLMPVDDLDSDGER